MKRHARAPQDLEEVFKRLSGEHVRIKRTDRVINNKVLYLVLKEVLQLMKRDTLFKNMKPRLEFMGSYYDGLRVGQPTEFDINIVFKLPVNYDKIHMYSDVSMHDYTHIKMPCEFRKLCKNSEPVQKGFFKTKMWCNHHYDLSVIKFRSWVQSVIDAALNTLPAENGFAILMIKHDRYLIKKKLSGPANTFTIKGSQIKQQIDVDLVPTFSFQLPKKPENSRVIFDKIKSTGLKTYFVVPKATNDNFAWRLSFPFQERKYIHDKGYIKSVIKLLKLFRDAQGFSDLASYYIKTLFLWKSMDNEFWKDNSLSFLILYMMKNLRDNLEKGEIKNFWCPDNNLLENIKKETIENWYNRVCNVIIDIEENGSQNPEIVLRYFVK